MKQKAPISHLFKITSILVLFFFPTTLAIIGCTSCDNEAPSEQVSPDGNWKYVMFDRNCGATTGSNLQVSILPASESLPNNGGNAFIADDDHGSTSFVAQPEWLSSRMLRITYSKKARVFKKESKVADIQIEYLVQ